MIHTPAVRAWAIAGIVGLAAGMTVPQNALAVTCNTAAVTIDMIDGVAPAGYPVDSTACEGSFDQLAHTLGNLTGQAFADALNDGLLFDAQSISSTDGFNWTYLAKDEVSGAQGGAVEAGIGATSGNWFADFSLDTADVVAVLLKGGREWSAFLFLDLVEGSLFEGTFDMNLAGIRNPAGRVPGLSHLEVAGLLVGGFSAIPVPKTLPLFLTGLLGLAFLARRRRQMAEA